MFGERYITEEERQKIKENRKIEKEINHYQYAAVGRMKHIESAWKHKNYKDRY